MSAKTHLKSQTAVFGHTSVHAYIGREAIFSGDTTAEFDVTTRPWFDFDNGIPLIWEEVEFVFFINIHQGSLRGKR